MIFAMLLTAASVPDEVIQQIKSLPTEWTCKSTDQILAREITITLSSIQIDPDDQDQKYLLQVDRASITSKSYRLKNALFEGIQSSDGSLVMMNMGSNGQAMSFLNIPPFLHDSRDFQLTFIASSKKQVRKQIKSLVPGGDGKIALANARDVMSCVPAKGRG